MPALEFSDAAFERGSVRADYDLEIGVTATLVLRISETVVYREVMFPIVELRTALDRWIGEGGVADFEFVSMESEETGLVWFRRQPSGGWRMGSVHQDDPAFQEFDWEHVVAGVERYVGKVDRWVELHLGVRVTDVVDL